MKEKIRKQDREKLDNGTMMLTLTILLYGLLLLFIQKMSYNSITVNGALAFIQIMRWAALAGAMLCAAWSAYKEKKSFFLYCGICIYVFLSTTVLIALPSNKAAYYINFIALGIAFVLNQVYYYLNLSSKIKSKTVKLAFIIVCAVLFIAVGALCIYKSVL